MHKKRVALTIVITLVAALLAGFAAGAASAGAPGGSYTATVKYYDDVMITYSLDYPSGGSWMGSGDIPIGGAGIASQLFCADPFVAFHSVAETTWSNTTTDTMSGYVAAAPWAVSGALRQNYDAVRWLVLNGYRGVYNHGSDDDAESKASVAWLQSLYPGVEGIDKTVALMATKVSIWKVLAGDSVNIIRTSLDPNRQAAFDALIAGMVTDALQNRETGRYMTELTVGIEEDKSGVTTAGGFTYVPLTVTVQLNNPGGTGSSSAAVDRVYLTVSGPDSELISFAGDTAGAQLPSGVIYGTDRSASYIEGGGFTDSGAEWTWTENVWMKIPAGRAPSYGDKLTVQAMAGATGVELCAGTPVTLVYGAGGVQDWDYVQAFIGAANDGISTSMYADGSLYTGDTPLGSIYIQKLLDSNSQADSDNEFTFAVYASSNSSFSSASRIDLTAHPVHAANSVDTVNNTFTLKHGGLAFIDGIPAGDYYWVEEFDSGMSEYDPPVFNIPVAASVVDSAAALQVPDGFCTTAFQMDDGDAMVTFFNSHKPQIRNARLRIGKVAIGLDPDGDALMNMMGEEFEFILQYREDEESEWKFYDLSGCFTAEPNANAPDGEFGGGRLVSDGKDGRFVLSHYGQAMIDLDPAFEYRVADEARENYASAYALGVFDGDEWHAVTGAPSNAYWKNRGNACVTNAFSVDPDGYYKLVFTNVDIPNFDLTISKTIEDPDRMEAISEFQIIYTSGGISAPFPWTIPLTADPSVYEAMLVTGGDGDSADVLIKDDNVLCVMNGESFTVTGLPAGHYTIRELTSDGFLAEYSINGGEVMKADEGSTGDIHLVSDMRVDFVNKAAQGDTVPETPEEPETPDSPEPEETPETNDVPGKPNIPPHIVFQEDKDHTHYPDIDFEAEQPDDSTPGGTDQGAPPTVTVPGNSLMPQHDDDGSVYFTEMDSDGMPLGEWRWDDGDDAWFFDDDIPLGDFDDFEEWDDEDEFFFDLPTTSGAIFPYWMLALSAFLLSAGLALEAARRHTAKKRKQ